MTELRRYAEEIRLAELRRVIDSSPSLGEAELLRLDAVTRSLIKKLLHEPSRWMRRAGATASGRAELQALPELVADAGAEVSGSR